jgi:shikimate dehydrogenase
LTPRPTRLVLLGHPVAHSLSPTFQNAALQAAGIPLTYEARDVASHDLAAVLRALTHEGAAGNVTAPHKAAVAACCARLTPIAQRVGAVNTFWVEDGALVGDNTDVEGFHNAVVQLRGAAPAHATVAVLGAGGAAGAAVAAIAGWEGCTARVWNRTAERARALCARFPGVAIVVDSAIDAVAGAALVVHATTVGVAQDAMPIDPSLLPRGADVMDLVYRPGETLWVRAARDRGHRAADGLPMLIEQGALAFERWFGQVPNRAAMWAAMWAAVGR